MAPDPQARAEHLAAWRDAVSDAALKRLTSAAVFGRGQVYAADGSVRSPELRYGDGDTTVALLATVQGSQIYRVGVMAHPRGELEGDCNCPHASEGNFCKHQVAVALRLRAVLSGAPDAAPVGRHMAPDLPEFLARQDASNLAAKLWHWAQQDPELMAKLKAWAATAQIEREPEPPDGAQLHAAVHALLDEDVDLMDWRDSSDFADRGRQVCDLIEPLIASRPQLALALSQQALSQIYPVCELADDSDGEISDLVADLRALLLRAVGAAQPSGDWLDTWFDLMAGDPLGGWDEAAILAAAGPALQACFDERALRDWQAFANAIEAGSSGIGMERFHRRARYLLALERRGDPQAVIQAMSLTADGAHEWHELVGYCESTLLNAQALAFARSAVQRFPHDHWLEGDLLRGLEREGLHGEALPIRRRQLERSPTRTHFAAALDAAERCGRPRADYRAELFAWAESQEILSTGRPEDGELRVVSIRVDWHLQAGDWRAALDLVSLENDCRDDLMLSLAEALPRSEDAAAALLMQRLFANEMRLAKSPYQRALALVRGALARMTPVQRGAWLSYLGAEFRAKRNFISGLPAP